MDALFDQYRPLPHTEDECCERSGAPRSATARVVDDLEALGRDELQRRQLIADTAFRRGGVTFSVYASDEGVEKVFPFDLIPRIIPGDTWAELERGLIQRVEALNLFLLDIYGDQKILEAGIIPRDFIEGSTGYLPEMRGVRPPGDLHIHVGGIDLIRGGDGVYRVLEDNIRTPSGVSYVLENREVMKRVLPRVFGEAHVRPVDQYPRKLREALCSMSPLDADDVNLVVLTPGAYNSAYFEHTFLARSMGCDLVQASDLYVGRDDRVYVKTTRGPRRVDVIYRRIDDDFLDPEVFRKDSLLGVPGIVRAYARGKVVLANGIGNGVADDKAIYPFVHDMIRFYLGQEPLLEQVKTYVCARPDELAYTLTHLDALVVKAVDASGGYGMLMGPSATAEERAEFTQRIKDNPRGYIAQPLVQLSTCPTWTDEGVAPRRVDLRPFIVTGKHGSYVLPGGLTRVALEAGSYVVNSSQGGGSKDTWVLDESPAHTGDRS
ncbi:MAG: circularly permuted type 2 ATP-grasp protein [Bradymonadia bacterium]